MPRKDEIARSIVLIYLSRNSAGFTNFTRPAGWLDKLPMAGLEELAGDFERFKAEVEAEIDARKRDGIPKFSRRYHDEQEAERVAGEKLLSGIGIPAQAHCSFTTEHVYNTCTICGADRAKDCPLQNAK